MNKMKIGNASIATIAFLVVSAASPLMTSGKSPVPDTPAHAKMPAARARVSSRVTDYLGGINLTEEQKVKIAQIYRKEKSHFEAVANDAALDADKKRAMMQGFQRLENAEVFEVLTPDQQTEVRRRFRAAKQSAVADQQKKPVAPPVAKP